MIRAVLTLAVAVPLVVLCGCGRPDTPVEPNSAPTARPSSSGVGRYGAPDVTQPRDLRRRDRNPCALLTPAQLSNLGIHSQGQTDTDAVGQARCTWEDRSSDQAVILIADSQRDLLVDAYRTPLVPVLRPAITNGLPVLYQQTAPGSPDCAADVGVAPGQGFDVDFHRLGTPRHEDTCGPTSRFVDAIISNLPPGA